MLINKIPIDLTVLVLGIIFAFIKSRTAHYINPLNGILAVMASVMMGYLLAWYLVSETRLAASVIVALSSLLSYFGAGVLVAMDTVGLKILANPTALAKAALPAFLSKLIPDDEPKKPINPN